MVQPVQTTPSASSTPFPPSLVNPPYIDQFGMSTLSQGLISRKSLIVLGFLAAATVLIILWRKLFSTESVPTEIQNWVNQNCKDLDAKHQSAVARGIVLAKKKIDRTINPNVGEIIETILGKNTLCNECKKAKTYVLWYFQAHPPVLLVPTFPLPNNEEIRSWILRRYVDTSEEVLVQVVQRVHAIEGLPACSQDPKALIRNLRSESITSINPDPIQSKALAFLTFKYKLRK